MYEKLLNECTASGITVKDKKMHGHDGLWYENRIAIRKGLSEKEKICVLAEELGHYHLTHGNILDLSNTSNQKQEHKARIYSYDKLIGIQGIINAYRHRCANLYEMAEFLNVTEEFLSDALNYYHSKHGLYIRRGNYVIYFNPLSIVELY